MQIFWLPVCPVACGVKLAAATLEIAVDGGGVWRVLDVVPHLVVVRQQDEVGVPLSHHSSLQQTDRLAFLDRISEMASHRTCLILWSPSNYTELEQRAAMLYLYFEE